MLRLVKRAVLLCVFAVCNSAGSTLAESCKGIPDCHSNTPEIIVNYGFVPEIHTCRTLDGFHLTLHRVVKNPPSDISRGTVLLMHGLLDSSSTWVMNGRNGSLAFILADAGFDVWLGNSRGNYYSRAHDSLTPSDKRFWQWTFDEMARYDLPAMVGYVCTMARVEKISFVGHSQGTMQAFAALAVPEIARDLAPKLNLFVALAPVAHLRSLESPLLRALADVDADGLVELFGDRGFLPSSTFLRNALPAICGVAALACDSVACMISGCVPGSRSHINHTRWPVYSAHLPSGTSVRNMAHFAQGVRGGDFRRFDFGTLGNLERYHALHPPLYALGSSWPVPTAMFSGNLDTLADPPDVERLLHSLPPGMVVWNEELHGWDHLTFVWGDDAGDYLYPRVASLIQQHTPHPTTAPSPTKPHSPPDPTPPLPRVADRLSDAVDALGAWVEVE